jgi:metal-sulfur cluster biosynthetic enzyme
MSDPDRVAEVLARLGHVTDPELDEPVTELGVVTGVAVAPDGSVAVEFRLPTYWCAANFAFMMADDMRREVSVLPWVTRVEPHLGEHMYAEKINHGVQHGLSFQEAFAEEAAGDLDELRRTFLIKAFQRRQEALILHLRGIGQAAETVTALSLDALRRLKLRAVAGPAPAEALAFVDAQGHGLVAAELPTYLRALRRIGTNAEFNGALCSGLLAARFGEAPIEPINVLGSEPTLRDFIRDAARGGTARQGRAA